MAFYWEKCVLVVSTYGLWRYKVGLVIKGEGNGEKAIGSTR